MANSPAISFRIAQEVQDELKRQAESIGLNATEYLRMIIKLDMSKQIKSLKPKNNYKNPLRGNIIKNPLKKP